MDDFKALFIPQTMIIGTENVERPSVLTEKMTKVLKFSYSNGQERTDDSAQSRSECVCACVRARAQRPVVCDIVHVVPALAILMSFSGLRHFDDNAIKW